MFYNNNDDKSGDGIGGKKIVVPEETFTDPWSATLTIVICFAELLMIGIVNSNQFLTIVSVAAIILAAITVPITRNTRPRSERHSNSIDFN